MARKSFILHNDSLAIVKEVPDDFAGKFIKAIIHYQETGELPEMDFALKMLVTPFIQQFARDNNKYLDVIERNKANGSQGGRPKGSKNKNPKNPVGLKKPTKTQQNPTEPKKPDNDNDSVNDNDSDSDYNKNHATSAKEVVANASYPIGTFKNVEQLGEEAMKDTIYFIPAVLRKLQGLGRFDNHQLKQIQDKLPQLMEDFVLHLRGGDVRTKDVTGFREHFKNWVCKQTFPDLMKAGKGAMVTVVNCATAHQSEMLLADWNRYHANDSNTVYKLLSQV